MSPRMFIGCAIALATVVVMEGVAYAVHRYVMHGAGWALHRSHHRPRNGLLEANDLFGLIFAAVSIGFIFGSDWRHPAYWIGVGMALYGLLYALLHDGLVHRRFPFFRALGAAICCVLSRHIIFITP